MDGNNRWSQINDINRYKSYNKGASNLLYLSNKIFLNTNVNHITAFALSANNLKRSKKIVKTIISILDFNLDKALEKEMNFSISFRGDLRFLSSEIRKKIDILNQKKINNNKKLIILMNFSGRQDVLDTSQKLINSQKIFNLSNFFSTKTVEFAIGLFDNK